MLFTAGSRVRFIHTGDEGHIIEQLSDGMLLVQLDDGDAIPAFEEHLQNVDLQKKKKDPVPPKPVIPPPAPVLRKAPDQRIENPLGIQLAFEDTALAPGMQPNYKIHLINDTVYSFIFTIELHLAGKLHHKLHEQLEAYTAVVVGTLPFDQLNDYPKFVLNCWQVTTLGTGRQLTKTLKIKAKQFLKRTALAPILNKTVHHYVLLDQFEESTGNGEDLKSYTKRNARARRSSHAHRGGSDMVDPMRFASFVQEIDLHAEKLSSDAHKMNNAEILRLQIQHFDNYMRKAIQIGVDRVFIIHGLGKGRLRDSIASRLIRMPEVVTFRNEYHPKYGYGATEVVFTEKG
ncbi:MAG: Smr/MutS family protein [Bacteroidota bacterium]